MSQQESFSALFEESIKARSGNNILIGTVVGIDTDYVTVDVGLKSEDFIPVEQFKTLDGSLEVEVGDEIEVVLDMEQDYFGKPRLSREKAKRAKVWQELAEAEAAGEVVTGVVSGKVKGGFTVDLKLVRAFLPGSLVDVRPVRDVTLEGKELEFKIIKLDQKRNNVVVSRRLAMESENNAEREALLETLQEGQVVQGTVKDLTGYGAFVDLGGIDGLLHITDMAWKRVKEPSEVVTVGESLEVKILKLDRERSRVSLGLKQLGEDPWVDIARDYPEGAKLSGRVTSTTDYGCFVEIEEGVEGLVHVSEMDWTNKNIHPSKVVQLNDKVDVMVLEIDQDRRRISLGLKQCRENPWDAFAKNHAQNEKITGTIKSITDFGIFIGLEGGIDGLIHLSDLSWDEPGEEVVRQYKRGQEVTALILVIDPERERISLGIKQLEQDAFSQYATEHAKGSIVTGTVTEVDEKGALVHLAEEVEGYIKASELSQDARVKDARTLLKEGDTVQAKLTVIDRKNRTIFLSVKARENHEEKEALKVAKKNEKDVVNPTLGDLLKKEMGDAGDP